MPRDSDRKTKRRAPAHGRSVSTIPPERVSHTSMKRVSGRPASDEAVTSTRVPRHALEMPGAAALERLLGAAAELPFAEGERAVVEAIVGALSEALEGTAVGACIVPCALHAAAIPEPLVVKRLPPSDATRATGIDPTRLFPGHTHERVVDLAGLAGSTLHVASEDAAIEDDRSPPALLVRRAAQLLARGVEEARVHVALAKARGDLAALGEHAIQADKLASFGQIAAGMVHELNNPLTSIVAYTDYLIRKFMAQSSAGLAIAHDDLERLKKIGDSANRMLRFTRDLVSYARPSGEALVPVVLRSTIEQAIAFCEHVIAESGTTIERRYGEDVLSVRARHEQLTQVFVNLVTNACHAVPREGGRIAITTDLAPDGRMVRVTMEDNGHGIEPENLSRVFAPFFTTKRDGRGTGLGLSIVKNIVEGHDGSISVTSEPRVGTRFVIRLPAFRRDD